MRHGIITPTIRILSLVSLLTDVASEMLYPVMPVFLRSIGFSFLLIGILEGVAEATAGLSKSYFGEKSDRMGKRLPFVQIGYSFSAISKPMMAAFVYPWWIFFARMIDRLGKGIRTGARDAMLSDESSRENKGKVFGFHRSMDTVGAAIGPALAMGYLYYYPGHYKTLFLVAFIPGILAILLTLLIKEKRPRPEENIFPTNNNRGKQAVSLFSFYTYWKKSTPEYKRLVSGFLLFAMFNSSDVFLLLKMKESGLQDTAVIGVYIFYNLVYALMAYPVGMLADRLGMKNVFLSGLFIFAIVYTGFAMNSSTSVFFVLFFLYGVYAAATEGISKAWISNIVPGTETATAIGTYTGLQSICLLIASSLTGFLWFRFGSIVTFTTTAGVTLIVIAYLYYFHKTPAVVH
jgi:MFS family permease